MQKVVIDKANYNRAILTDTLPYEVPMFFTNEPFFRWLSNDALKAKSPAFVAALLQKRSPTKPFSYQVRKSGGGIRRLAVPHPAAQHGFAELYRDFDSFIENVCGRSQYSLRFPTRVGSHFYQSQFASNSEESSTVDADPSSFANQRKWASSYFSYQRYTHIHKFFGSKEFLRLAQKFSFMLKLDVARCFESIYTHSVVWAVRGKEFGKDNIRRRFFESEFDRRMQAANWGETNGILIGPEVSRVFAETVMQSIDVELAERLGPDRSKLAVARYVDDFFVFSNSKDLLSRAQSALEEIASKYNLHFNPAKTETVSRPFVAPFAVARQRVRILLTELLRIASANIAEESPTEKFSSRASEKALAEIRRISRQYNVDYSILASPALAVIASGLGRLRRKTTKSIPNVAKTRIEAITSSILRISTFFYLMDIKAATSDKLARVFLECSRLNERAEVGRLAFEGMVIDSLRLALEQARLTETTGPEIVNILVAADAVCSRLTAVPHEFLRSALGVQSTWAARRNSLNYFDLISVLYFSRDMHSFAEAREAACTEIEERLGRVGSRVGDYAEETMLLFDFLSCPYIPESRRFALFAGVAKVLGANQNPATTKAQFDLVRSSLRFVAWDGAKDFRTMLARRELQPAYDS
jgi:hypothetical protein